MGCSVNGYGEMLNSDIGLIGKSSGKVDLYQKNKLLFSNIEEEHVAHYIETVLSSGALKNEKALKVELE